MSPGCGHAAAALALVEGVVRETAPGAEVVTVMVGTLEDAERLGFLGSPSIRVDGLDVDPQVPGDVGLG